MTSHKAAYFCLGTSLPCFMEPQGIVKAFRKRKKVKDDLQIAPKGLKEEIRNGKCSIFIICFCGT